METISFKGTHEQIKNLLDLTHGVQNLPSLQREDSLNDVWQFVTRYYPNYYGCNEIAINDDLHKIINGELNGQAEEMVKEYQEELKEMYGLYTDDEVLNHFQDQLYISDATIFEKAIQGYIDNQASPKKTYFLLGAIPVCEYENNGIEGVIALFKTEQEEDSYLTEGEIFVYTEGETIPFEIVSAVKGWDDFAEITEEEYNKLIN
jgi:hypothetical protein